MPCTGRGVESGTSFRVLNRGDGRMKLFHGQLSLDDDLFLDLGKRDCHKKTQRAQKGEEKTDQLRPIVITVGSSKSGSHVVGVSIIPAQAGIQELRCACAAAGFLRRRRHFLGNLASSMLLMPRAPCGVELGTSFHVVTRGNGRLKLFHNQLTLDRSWSSTWVREIATKKRKGRKKGEEKTGQLRPIVITVGSSKSGTHVVGVSVTPAQAGIQELRCACAAAGFLRRGWHSHKGGNLASDVINRLHESCWTRGRSIAGGGGRRW